MFDTAHIHPMLVHFPIALALLGVLLEGIGLAFNRKCPSRCGETILYFATISALLAATAGSYFTPDFKVEELANAKNIHSTLAGITVTMLCLASACYLGRLFWQSRASLLRSIGFVFYLLGAIAVGITGYLGGVLVYNDLLKM